MQDFTGNLRTNSQLANRSRFLNTLQNIVRTLSRRATIVTAVPAGAVAALLLYVWTATPQYAATATVFIDLPKAEKTNFSASPPASPQITDADMVVESQAKLIRSSVVLTDVVDRLGLAYDSEFAPPLGTVDRLKKRFSLRASAADGNGIDFVTSRVLEHLRNRVSVSRDEKTVVINIEATSAQAIKAAAIANATATSYLKRPEFGGAHLVTSAAPPVEPLPVVGWPMFGFVLAAGAAFGGFLAVAMEGHDRRIKTLTQLNEISGLPALAAIPQVGTRERARRAKPNREELRRYDPTRKTLLPPSLQPPLMRYAFDDPTSTFADGIRAVRLAIQRASSGARSEIVMVTSASDSEGKSTLSTNLARSFAMAGVNTVLVDCDLRNPEVTGSLCPRVDRGLTEAAFHSESIGRFILDEEVSGLSVLPAPPSPNFNIRTELAFTPQFSSILARLRDRFEVIVLDAPPLIPLTDSRALADHADSIILTAAWNETRQDVLMEGLQLLAPNLHRVLGCVLSRVDMERLRYYDRTYGQAYREPYRPSL